MIDKLKKIMYYNRIFFINTLSESQNKVRFTGFIWGTVATGILWATVMRNFNILRKMAVFVTLFHVGGTHIIILFNRLLLGKLFLYDWFY